MMHIDIVTEWVDTREAAEEACAFLQRQSVLAFDMEGVNLGKHGQISLLQLAVLLPSIPERSERRVVRVYIFDFLTLQGYLLSTAGLGGLLRSHTILKLCYDCRCDAEALCSLHNLVLGGLIDLQIAYTLLFQAVSDPYLKGFHKALSAPGVLSPNSSSVIATKQHVKAQCDFGVVMMERPLSPRMLTYCALDVAYLFAMDSLWAPCVSRAYLAQLTKQRMFRFMDRRDDWCMSRLDFFATAIRPKKKKKPFPAASSATRNVPAVPVS